MQSFGSVALLLSTWATGNHHFFSKADLENEDNQTWLWFWLPCSDLNSKLQTNSKTELWQQDTSPSQSRPDWRPESARPTSEPEASCGFKKKMVACHSYNSSMLHMLCAVLLNSLDTLTRKSHRRSLQNFNQNVRRCQRNQQSSTAFFCLYPSLQ